MVDLAEQLFGEWGIDGVSLRQISLRAGSKNRTAIQYHFRDVDGLIRAILSSRMPQIDDLRRVELAKIEPANEPISIRQLMDILYLPIINHVDGNSNRSHARFMLSLLTSSRAAISYDLFESLQPNALRAIRLLVDATGVSEPLLLERQRLVAIMVLTSIFNRLSFLTSPDRDAALIENALAMATSAITAPVELNIERDFFIS